MGFCLVQFLTNVCGFLGWFAGSAFMVVRVPTAVSWGIAEDKYGGKPIMLISLISV
jgi:Na+/melibiose symporter-like transporter